MAFNREYLQRQIVSADPEDHKSSVRFATTGSIPAYNKVGNVITATANGAFPVQDGLTPVQGDDFLLWHGASDADNGIYTIIQLGDGASPFILNRRGDADSNEFVTSGMRVPIAAGGTLYGGQEFILMTPDPIVLNTTGLTFELREEGSGATPFVVTGDTTEEVPDNKRMVYAHDIRIEDDGDVVPDGDINSSDSFDNHTMGRVPVRQTRVVAEHEVMFIHPDLVVDGELVIDGDLVDVPEVQISGSNVVAATDNILTDGQLLGKDGTTRGINPSEVLDWINAVSNLAQITDTASGAYEGYFFGDVATWRRASIAKVNADGFSQGLVIRGLYANLSEDGFLGSKLIVNTSAESTVVLLDETDVDTDSTVEYRIKTPKAVRYFLAPGEICLVVYDSVLLKWVVANDKRDSVYYEQYLSDAAYPTWPGPFDLVDLQKWLQADVMAFFMPDHVTIHGLAWKADATGIDVPVSNTKIIINRNTFYTISLMHDSAANDPSEKLYCTSSQDIVLGGNDMAIAVYSTGLNRWIVAKLLGTHKLDYHSSSTLSELNSVIAGVDLLSVAYGEMVLSNNGIATTLAAEPTFTRINGLYSIGLTQWFSFSWGSAGFSGALEYTGAQTKVFQVVASISCSASAPDVVAFRLAVNGTTVAKSEARRYLSSVNDEGVVVLTALVSLAQNDYVEVFAARVGVSANITVDEMNVNIVAAS